MAVSGGLLQLLLLPLLLWLPPLLVLLYCAENRRTGSRSCG